MRILLTGHKGFVGHALAQRFRPYQLTCIDKDEPLPQLFYFDRFDVVIACGAISDNQYKNPDILRYNVSAIAQLLKTYPDAYFVYLSSQTARNPKTLYGYTKECAELLISAACNNACILQPFNIYGEGEDRKAAHCRSLPYRLADHELEYLWDTARDYVHIDDVVDAVSHAVKHRYVGTYHLGTSNTTESFELASLVSYHGYRTEQRPTFIEYGSAADGERFLPNWKPKQDVRKQIQLLEQRLSMPALEPTGAEYLIEAEHGAEYKDR